MPGSDKKKKTSPSRFNLGSLTQRFIPTPANANGPATSVSLVRPLGKAEVALKELAFSVAGLNAATVKDSPDLDLQASMKLFAIDGVRRHKVVVDYGKGEPDIIIHPNPTTQYEPEAFLTELSQIPESWLNIVCRCRQNVYTCHLIAPIHKIFSDAGILLAKDSKDEQNCHNNFEIICKIETGEIIFIETNNLSGIRMLENGEYYPTGGYIKTTQVFNLHAEYSKPPTVKIHLPKLALDMAEKTLKAKAEKPESASLELAFLGAMSPLGSTITSLFSTTRVFFGASSSTPMIRPASSLVGSRSEPVLPVVSMASPSSMPASASAGVLTMPLPSSLESKPLSPG